MTDELIFVANLPPIQSALTMSGDGQRCLIKLEAFNIHAALANIGLQKFANQSFEVIVKPLSEAEINERKRNLAG